MREFIKVSKAISDETRVRILKLLGARELCVCQLMAILGMGQSTVSKHLGILKNAGLVEVRKDWTWSFYKLTREGMNTYPSNFLKFLSSVLNDDTIIREDKERLKEVAKKDLKVLCAIGKKK